MNEITSSTKILRVVVGLLAAGLLVTAGLVGYAYSFSPTSIRKPTAGHPHMRLQLVVSGKEVDFGATKFQTPYAKDVCTAKLTAEPIHFHDGLGQFVHIHWTGVTGGMLLKNYGWNLIGGPDGSLGYRFDQLPKIIKVPIHGKALPARSPDARFFIYTGDESSYKLRNWNQFLDEDIQTFISGKTVGRNSLLNSIIPVASAHNEPTGTGASEEELIKLNDVIGNAVIFVQKDAPTDAQIKDRFNDLIALPESVCGG